LPSTLAALGLSSFWYDETDLCEPGDATFQTWLGGIPNLRRTDVICGTQAVSGTVWDDANRDGVQDAGEPGVAGITVTLARDATMAAAGVDAPGRQVLTGGAGEYRFANVAPGAYTVTVTPSEGYLPSGPGSVAVTVPAEGDVVVPPLGIAEEPVHLYMPLIIR